MVGNLPQARQENARRLVSGISFIPQSFERRREPDRRKRAHDLGRRNRRGCFAGGNCNPIRPEPGKGRNSRQLELSGRDCFGALIGDRCNLILNEARAERRNNPALRFDLLENRPPFLRQFRRYLLDVPRPTRGIDDPPEVRFLLRHNLRIARNAPGKRVGGTKRITEWQHQNLIGPAESCRRCGDGRSQRVGPGIAPRHHAGRRNGGETHLTSRSTRAAGLRDPRNHGAGRPQFRRREKDIGVGCHMHTDLRQRLRRRYTLRFERPQVGGKR